MVISVALMSTLTRGGMSCFRLPLGPVTSRLPSLSTAFTPLGKGTGFLPMRLIFLSLPHLAENLATHLQLPGLSVGHHPLGGGDHCHSQAALHLGELGMAGVDPAPGL